jgi:hypothetical protein
MNAVSLVASLFVLDFGIGICERDGFVVKAFLAAGHFVQHFGIGIGIGD